MKRTDLLRYIFLLPALLICTALMAQHPLPDEAEETGDEADSLTCDTLTADTAAVDFSLPWPQSVQARIGRLLENSRLA